MNKDQAIAEWRRARESLGAAATYESTIYYADSISRAYYAAFHAAKSPLLLDDIEPRTHEGVIRRFGERIVRIHHVEPVWGRELNQLQKLRNDADYEVEMVFGEADARAAYQRAAAFLHRIRALLTIHIPLDELEP
ncbi:MAG: HEPN domain-containing protein [Chloroflexota bacterium]|nr:HEPN domain-containing protein [Chloroflexota bacterium]MDE2959569.1 HEPN domain-containing protein [Chloroflexota bacterium]